MDTEKIQKIIKLAAELDWDIAIPTGRLLEEAGAILISSKDDMIELMDANFDSYVIQGGEETKTWN